MRLAAAALILLMSLIACEGPGADSYYAEQAADGAVRREAPQGKLATPVPSAPVSETDDSDQPSGRLLAFRHGLSILADNKAIAGLVENHTAKCRSLGPEKCLVTGSNIQSWDDYSTNATLSLSIAPDIAQIFMDELVKGAADAGGRVTARSTNAEDLTRSIIDTDARLKARVTLRDRLQDLLANHEGKLSDLIEIERELARVQGEIDSLTSNLKAMWARVDMAALTITYESRVVSTHAPATPLKNAFAAFWGNLAEALANIITFVAHALPWGIALIILFFILRLFWYLFGFRFPRRRRSE